jgi:hypothetical protein
MDLAAQTAVLGAALELSLAIADEPLRGGWMGVAHGCLLGSFDAPRARRSRMMDVGKGGLGGRR